MPKIACKCGYVMNIGSLDEDFAYDLISQNILWDLIDIWSEKKNLFQRSLWGVLMLKVLRCTNVLAAKDC